MQCRAGQVRDRRLKRTETIVKRQQRVSPKRDDRGSVGPTVISSNVARFRHFATVLGLIPSSRLSCASEACPYRDIALQCPAGQRDRGAPVTNLSHAASFHSFERIAPSNHGIRYLMCLGPAIDAPSPLPARTGDGVGYSAEHLVA